MQGQLLHQKEAVNGMLEKLLSPEEVSEMLGVPLGTLYQWQYRGVGPPALKVGRHLRYRPSELEAWLEQKEAKPEDQGAPIISYRTLARGSNRPGRTA